MQPTNRIAQALNGSTTAAKTGEAAAQPAPGRDSQGRFTKGNRGGPGNPFTRQIAGFRRALCNAVTEQDIQELGQILLAKAKAGDLLAIKLLLLYAVGRPAEVAEPDRLDAHEMQLYRQNNADEETMAELLRGTPADFALAVLRMALPLRGLQLARYAAEQLGAGPAEDKKPAPPEPPPATTGPETETPPPPARKPRRTETAAPMTNGTIGARKARVSPPSPLLRGRGDGAEGDPAPMTNGDDGVPVAIAAQGGQLLARGPTDCRHRPQAKEALEPPMQLAEAME